MDLVEQLALLGDSPERAPAADAASGQLREPGTTSRADQVRSPGRVARVVLDVALPHLDRPFDYTVPADLEHVAVPGARVSARFAGRDTAGFIVARADHSDHVGGLAPLRRVVSPVPVLTPEVHSLARAVADRYAGTLADVLRLAVPPRHARTEAAVLAAAARQQAGAQGTSAPDAGVATDTAAHAGTADPARRAVPGDTAAAVPGDTAVAASAAVDPWAGYEGGVAFVRRLAAGESPRAVWLAVPDGPMSSRRAAVAAAVSATLASGRGVVVVAPEAREVGRLGAALDEAGIEHARLVAEDGPAARYRSFMRLLLGQVRVVVGTRAAAFAPVQEVGLVVLWDDGDDLLAEPRAPYPHALGVLRLRAELARAGALIGGYARTCAAQQLLADGWARPVQAGRATVRELTPRVVAPDDADLAREGPAGQARIPHPAWELARSALASGPVLVQVPRAGYVLVTACARCRAPARCSPCSGPLRIDRPEATPSCSWCGRPDADWTCGECGSGRLRAGRLGSTRTAEELGRAFPGVPVVVSGAAAPGGVIHAVDRERRIVVATPGAEPEAEGSYAAALLLDAAVSTSRPELWAAEEALRRWLGAAALVRAAPYGGRAMLLGRGAPVPSQALIRWDPGGFAERELQERASLGFPPAVAMASAQGPPGAVSSFLGHLDTALGAEVLGPVPVEPRPASGGSGSTAADDAIVRAIVRTDRTRGRELSRALAHAAAVRSARKEPGSVRVQIDPSELW